jgi:hypothetical protein
MERNGAPTDAAAAAAPVVKLRVSYGGGFVLGEFFSTMDVSFLFLRSLSSSRNPPPSLLLLLWALSGTFYLRALC